MMDVSLYFWAERADGERGRMCKRVSSKSSLKLPRVLKASENNCTIVLY